MGLLFGDDRMSTLKPASALDIVSCTAGSPSRTGTVRVSGLTGFAGLVSELGGDAQRLIAACGLSPSTLANPDHIIPFGLGARLLHLAAAELQCPHFGLLLGQRQDLALLGPIGFLMQHSPDVRSALANLLRYMHLHVEGASARVALEERLVEFSYRILIPGVLGAEQVYGVCMANEFRFMQMLCGRDWRPAAVHFCFRAPPDETPFRGFFGAPVRFDQPASAVYFPAHYLERRISSADPALALIEGEDGSRLVADADGAALRPADAGLARTAVPWAEAVSLPDALRERIEASVAGVGVSAERVLLDLHSGRWLGHAGVWLMDAAAFALLLLAGTGGWTVWRRWRTRP